MEEQDRHETSDVPIPQIRDDGMAALIGHWRQRARKFYALAGFDHISITDSPFVQAISPEGSPTEENIEKPQIDQYPGVLLQATVVGFGDKTHEGQLIWCVAFPWFEIIECLTRDPAAAYQIPSRTWEEIIAGAYKKAGFEEVTLTPRSGDYGRDIIAVKWGLGSVRIIDQVKAYKPGHLVTADDIRALVGVLHGDGASKGFLTTTSDFAPRIQEDPLITPFMPSRIELINGSKLFKRLEELAKNKKI
jgi:restriction system protein